MDAAEPQVVTIGDVGYDGDVAPVETQTLPQHPTPRRLQHSGVDFGVAEYVPRALRPATVTTVDAAIVDEDAIGAGHAHTQPLLPQQVSNQARSRRFTVSTGHRDDRN